LFTNCNYVSPAGVTCNYPILVGQLPAYCNGHIDLVGGLPKETKPVPRKRKVPGEDDNKPELKKKVKEETKPPTTKVPDLKKMPIKKAPEKGHNGPPPPGPPLNPYYPTMHQSPVFLPHLLGRGTVPTAVPMPQYLNPRLYMQEGMRKVSDGNAEEQHKMNMNAMAGMAGRPDAFIHPTFFYHPGLLFNQQMKIPSQDSTIIPPPVPTPEVEKKVNT